MGRETAGWTLADAATWLDPPISPERLGLLVRAADVNAIGHRKPPPGSAGGRPAAVYEIRELQELHAAFVPWLLRIEGRALPSGHGNGTDLLRLPDPVRHGPP